MHRTPRPRQLLLGVDAMEWTLVERWAASGALPAFRRLLDTGLRARLATSAEWLPDTAWTTLAFGVNPGKLEKYFYVQYDPAAGRLRHATDAELRGTPFWEYLAQAGKQVGVVDVPHMPLHDVSNGFSVRGWGSHDIEQGPEASPHSLLAEIDAHAGPHPVLDCERYDATARHRLFDDVVAGVRRHGELFRWLMRSRPWDMFLGVFSAAHCGGHHFWSTEGEGNGIADAIERIYRAIDREVGETMAQAGADATAMVFAPHGMGPLHHASWNLNEILDVLGGGGPAPARARAARVNPWRILKMRMPSSWQYAIKARLPKSLQSHLLFLWYAGGRRSGGRRAFAIPNNEVTGAIRIGVRGRDAGGIVAPGAEYDRVCGEIADALRELVDPVSGRPVVATVTRLHDVCHGPYAHHLPDLTVRWDSSFAWSAVRSDRTGTLEIRPQDRRQGSHTPSSFLLACGPGIPAGVARTGHATLDVGPTVLSEAGVPVPEHMDGKPILLRG